MNHKTNCRITQKKKILFIIISKYANFSYVIKIIVPRIIDKIITLRQNIGDPIKIIIVPNTPLNR